MPTPAARLTEELRRLPAVIPPRVAEGTRHGFYRYIAKLNRAACRLSLAEFVSRVAAEGIPVSRRYPIPMYRQPLFLQPHGYGRPECPHACPFRGEPADYAQVTCPNAEALTEEAFTLLVHPTEGEREVADIAAAIAKVLAAV